MSLKYLFGPVSGVFAEQNLKRQRNDGTCLAFNAENDADLTIRFSDSWSDVRRQLPEGWNPDFIVLYLPYTSIPPCLWTAPLPRVGLALDWRLLWHCYRAWLPACELILGDSRGVEAMRAAGLMQAEATNLSGCERAFLETPCPGGLRDIDLLFIGNLNPAVHRERMPWLTRLVQLGKRWRVRIQAPIFGDAYRRLLARSRVVFHFSSSGKCGRRAWEAALAGALIFQEATNTELPAHFRDRRECVYYRDDDLEELVGYYLEHEHERQVLAAAAQAKARQFSFEQLWEEQVARIEAHWPALLDGAQVTATADEGTELLSRTWQALSATRHEDLSLLGDIEKKSKDHSQGALLHNAAGCLLVRQAQLGGHVAKPANEAALQCFQRALTARPRFALASLNLAELFDATGQRSRAIETARQALKQLDRDEPLEALSVEGHPAGSSYDTFRVEWERAGWEFAGNSIKEARAKSRLLRWRLHGLLGRWTDSLTHCYEAALSRPDLPSSKMALGEALIRANQPDQAQIHLRQAVQANALDREAALAYSQLLGRTGDIEGQHQFLDERRQVARTAPRLVPTEPWFAEPRPKNNELVSILILCCNQVDLTRHCLESIVRSTRRPYELVLVDNGSTDGTAEYLQEVRQRAGPSRVEIIHNTDNVGFAAGCNQALARSRGHIIVFLNNDTVVTPRWLDGLLHWLLRDWPAVGFVGPVTNGAPPPQWAAPGYECLDGLDSFAARRRREFAGRSLPVQRLTGFCLAARRDVLDRIGPLDHRFGMGFFEDDDLCLRAVDAGFRLLVAQDVYIHHFGSSTFKGLGLDTRQRLLDNFEVFKAKWGQEHAAAYHLPPPKSEPTDAAPATPLRVETGPSAIDLGVSLCMIVKNEESYLPDCLRSVAGLFDEIVVADTGSQDRTREIVQDFGARLIEFPWVDSFCAARNASLSQARGKWIMWLDADDRLDEENRSRLQKVLAGLGDELDAYSMKVRSALDAGGTAFRLLDQVRLFRNHPNIRWDYRIHEQILPAVNRLGGGVRWVNVVVDHVGYQDASLRQKKLDRNLRLLHLEVAERPTDSFALFNLGWTMLDLGKAREALVHLETSLEHVTPQSSIGRKLYHLLAVAHRQLGEAATALDLCREGLTRFPDDGELLLEQGLLLREHKDWPGAERSWIRLLHSRKGNYFASEDVGLRGFKTRQLLAEIFLQQDRLLDTEVQCRAALAERADLEPAWLGLAEVYSRQGRWHELEELVRNLSEIGVTSAKLGWLRGRAQIQRKEFAAARRTLAAVIDQDPTALGPRVMLSQILLQEGGEWQAAENALLDILEIDADNKDAKHNLQVLRRQRARPAPLVPV